MRHLSSLVMSRRGDSLSSIHEVQDISAQLLATMWIDRDQRYFLSTCKSPDASFLIERDHIRMVNGEGRNVTEKIRIPHVCREYYSNCAQSDQHNRHRKDSGILEKKSEFRDWEFLVDSMLLGMRIVDAYRLYIAGQAGHASQVPNIFLSALADALIHDTEENRARTPDIHDIKVTYSADLFACGTNIHLRRTNRNRKLENGQITNAVYQARSVISQGTTKSQFVRSDCYNVTNQKCYVCHSKTGRLCFKEHFKQYHDVDM